MVSDILQLLMEKGNHIKVRRQLEQVTSEHTQLVADSTQLQDDIAKLTSDTETLTGRELELKMAVDRLTAELKSASVDRDRLARELEDRRVRDMAVQDNIQVCGMLPLYSKDIMPVHPLLVHDRVGIHQNVCDVAFCQNYQSLRSRFGIERHPHTKSRIDQIPCVYVCMYVCVTTPPNPEPMNILWLK